MTTSNRQPPAQWAEDISLGKYFIFCGNSFYVYERGYYRKWHDQEIFKLVKDTVGFDYSVNKINEVIRCLEADCFKEPEYIANYLYLNLLNGLLNINTFIKNEHTHTVISTIQLQVSYKPESICPKWLKFLDEVFEGEQKKIAILQEYFGLCLTPDTKYDKALFLLGEGANGKSVILFILQRILGEENYSAIPLERFDNRHYLANLFGKLANISIETNAKSSVYDSTFKSVVSGDTLEADAKFKIPFKFRPCCKLVFALNNMPRVDDKTAAFFRRLLILKFNKVFQEAEQNKNLKFEIVEEINGIFFWSLQGLKRLRARGYFETTSEMQSEIEEYRKENNNVLVFVEEQCQQGGEYTVPKNEFYRNYFQWCKDHGNYPLQMIKFGKELKKQFPTVTDDRISGTRCWRGIKFNKLDCS